MAITRLSGPFLVLLLCSLARADLVPGSGGLSLERRLEAQRAIERVYWRHRVWPADNPGARPTFEEEVPEAALRDTVLRSLELSEARGITSGQLQAELDRMAASTRAPEVLHEIFEALGQDAELIAETLARQALAERLVRDPASRYVLPRIQGAAEARTRDVTLFTGAEEIVWDGSPGVYRPATDSWSSLPGVPVPVARRDASLVWTGSEVLVWGGVDAGGQPLDTGARYAPATGTWRPMTSEGAPSPRRRHAATWTGTEMAVRGGTDARGVAIHGGALYDPAVDRWVGILMDDEAVSPQEPTVGPATDVSCEDCVELGPETTGDYVMSVGTEHPLTGGAKGGDGVNLTLGIEDDGIGPLQVDENAPYAWAGAHRFFVKPLLEDGLVVGFDRGLTWSLGATSSPARIRIASNHPTFSGAIDHVLAQCYNCQEGSGGSAREDFTEHQFSQSTEYTYKDDPSSEAVEVNWDYVSSDGEVAYRPLHYFLRSEGGGATRHSSRWLFTSAPGEEAVSISNGGLRVGQGADVSGTLMSYAPAQFLGTATFLQKVGLYPVFKMTGAGTYRVLHSAFTVTSTETLDTPELFASHVDGSLNLTMANARSRLVGVYSNPRLAGGAAGNVTSVIGNQSIPQMGSTGTGTSVERFVAYRAMLFMGLGSNWSTDTACYFCAEDNSLVALPEGASLNRFYGVRVPDMHGLGGSNVALQVDAQTGRSASKGNIVHAGGGFDSGHLVLGATHLHQERGGLLRVTDGPPDSASDGNAIVTGSGSSARGVVLWGDASHEFDTGDEVCAASGLSCRAVRRTTGEEEDCATEIRPVGTLFYALCS
ncbi:MAG TPA: hypothetical protein VFV75_18530 [Candidatus Polarisedimenticolaceae bacterium]|nr:hypothetical protein [Candidatus Polarisedimenticolaceae bacterium]